MGLEALLTSLVMVSIHTGSVHVHCTLYMNTVKKGTISLPESRSEKPPRAAISDGSGA